METKLLKKYPKIQNKDLHYDGIFGQLRVNFIIELCIRERVKKLDH